MKLTSADLRQGNLIAYDYLHHTPPKCLIKEYIKEVKKLQVVFENEEVHLYEYLAPIPFEAVNDLPKFGFKLEIPLK
jgi:hypothetical protein